MCGTANKPITEYRKFFSVMFPSSASSPSLLKTVETFTEPEDRNVFSYVMESTSAIRAPTEKS